MAYYSYKNIGVSINGSGIFANEARLTVGADISPLYLAHKRNAFEFNANKGVGGVLNVNYYLTGTDPVKNFITAETQLSGNVGGLYFTSGYLQSYALRCAPNQTVTVSADIVFFDELKGVITPTYNIAPDIKLLNFADVTVSDPTNGNIGQISRINDLSFDYNVEIEPLYLSSETLPNRVVFGRKEILANINVDNYSGDMPITGKAAGVRIAFSHPSIPGLSENFEVNGVLFQRNISTQAGGLLQGVLTVIQHYAGNNPIITGFHPLAVATGDYVLISGQNFTNTLSVQIHDSDLKSFSVLSDILVSGVIPEGAVSGDLTVNTFVGTTKTGLLTINHGSIVGNSLIYSTGHISGKVTVSGSNFYRISDVLFTATPTTFTGSTFRVVSPSVLEAVVPLGTAWGPIRIASTQRNITGDTSVRFVPIPRITGFTPASGLSGVSVSIAGFGFSGVTGVLFNNLPNISPFTASFTVVGNTGITVTVPTGNTHGLLKLLGQSGVTAFSQRNFLPLVNITGFSVFSALTGTALDILGQNFLSDLMYQTDVANTFLVSFVDVTGRFTKINDAKLTGLIPYGARSGPVYIHDPNLGMYPSTGIFTIINPYPVINYISPSSGKASGIVNIYGNNFFDISAVKISGLGVIRTISDPLPIVDYSKTAISFQIPNVTGALYTIIINASAGDVTGNGLLTILDTGIFSGFNPTSGAIGDRVTITGINIYNASKVYFNTTGNSGVLADIDHTSFNAGNNQVVCYVPTAARTGFNTIIVYNSVNYFSGMNFRLIERPSISGFAPGSGEWGATISVSGRHIGNTTGVKIGVYDVNTFTKVGNTGVTITIPENSVTDFITLLSQAGNVNSQTRLAVQVPLVTFSGFTPLSGYYQDTLIISGARLQTVNQIRFTGDTTAITVDWPGFNIVGNSGLNLLVPQGVRSGKLMLRNERGLVQSTEAFVPLPFPGISGFTPQFAIFDEQISITGSSLDQMNFLFPSVNLGAYVIGNNISVIDGTGATVRIPRNIRPGPILISGRNRNFATSTGDFVPLPTITGFRPTGIVTGDVLRITGVNVYELRNLIFITGAGNFYNILTGNLTGNLTDISGSHITDFSTGFAVFSGSIGDVFVGTGNIFIISNYFTEVTNTTTFLTSRIHNQVQNIKTTGILRVQNEGPSV